MSPNKTHGKDYEEFGRRIARIRELKGLSQKDVSKLLGIPQSTYAGYETGTRKIPLSLIKELSKLYGVSSDSLLGNDTSEEPITLAAHFEGDDFTEEEIQEILEYAKYLKSKRKQK